MTTTDLEQGIAKLIWEASRVDEGSISATGANIIASALVAHGYGKLPLDPLPYYVEEADEGQRPDAGRYSIKDWSESAGMGEWGGIIYNLAVWKPREEYAQGKPAYAGAEL